MEPFSIFALLVVSFSALASPPPPFFSFSETSVKIGIIEIEFASMQVREYALSLDTPIATEMGLSLYSDIPNIYNETLNKTWHYGLKARESAYKMEEAKQTLTKKFKLDLIVTEIEFGEFSRYYEETKYNYIEAMNWMEKTLDAFKLQLAYDYALLDLMGADNETYTGMTSVNIKEIDSTAKVINAVISSPYARLEATEERDNPCKVDDIRTKTECLIKKSRNTTKSFPQQIDIYNAAVGFNREDSLLKYYYELHKSVLESIDSMKKEYADKNKYFNITLEELESKINLLEEAKIELIDQETINKITSYSDSNVQIDIGNIDSPQIKYIGLKSLVEEFKVVKESVIKFLILKRDNYLFNAINLLNTENPKLELALNQTHLLLIQLDSIKQLAEQAYEQQKIKFSESNLVYSTFFLKAVETVENKKQELGSEIQAYSIALDYFSKLSGSSLNIDYKLEQLERIISSLEKLGMDVENDKLKLNTLKTFKSESPEQTYIQANDLIEKLKLESQPALIQIEELRERANNMIQLALKLGIDSYAIKEEQLSYDSSLSKDRLENAKDLFDAYSSIIDSIDSKIQSFPTNTDQSSAQTLLELTEIEINALLTNQNLSSDKDFFNYQIRADRFDSAYPHYNELILELKDKNIDFKEYENLLFEAKLLKDNANFSFYEHNLELAIKELDSALSTLEKIDKAEDELKNYEDSKKKDMLEKCVGYDKTIESICEFQDCTTIRVVYSTQCANININTFNVLGLEDQISKNTTSILRDLNEIGQSFENILQLKKSFERAVTIQTTFEEEDLPYIEEDLILLYDEEDIKKIDEKTYNLEQVHKQIKTVLSDNTESSMQFSKLIEKISINDLKSYERETESMSEYINTSILSLKSKAKSRIERAKQSIEQTGDSHAYLYLKNSLDSYNTGYYNKAGIYAQKAFEASETAENGSDFPIIPLISVALLTGFAFYVLRKPKFLKQREKEKIVRVYKRI